MIDLFNKYLKLNFKFFTYSHSQVQKKWYRHYNIKHMKTQQMVSAQDLIIIITTSPIPSNPSTEIIDGAIESIIKEVTLSQVPIFIICDGAKISKENINKYKSGIVSQDTLNNYELFKDKIKNMYGKDPRFIIEERTERYCFAQNIRYVMSKVKQPYVLIFQHDHLLLRSIDFSLIIQKFKQNSEINYIGFMNKSVIKMPHTLDEDMNLRKFFREKIKYEPQGCRHNHQAFVDTMLEYYQNKFGIALMPLIFWYDKVHVARKQYYLDVIFNRHGFYSQITHKMERTVSFVEDTFGTTMMKNIRRNPQLFEQLGAFIYWDNMKDAIFHSRGRSFLTQQVKHQVFIKNIEPKEQQERQEEQMDDFHLKFMDE